MKTTGHWPYIFENIAVEPNHDGYQRFSDSVGDRGFASACISLSGSPMHLIQKELMPVELMFLEMYDHPEKLSECCEAIGGKYLLTHADGENSGLLDEYLDSEIDIADSICPTPMTKLSFKEVRDHFDGIISIMGGIPSITLLDSIMTDY